METMVKETMVIYSLRGSKKLSSLVSCLLCAETGQGTFTIAVNV